MDHNKFNDINYFSVTGVTNFFFERKKYIYSKGTLLNDDSKDCYIVTKIFRFQITAVLFIKES